MHQAEHIVSEHIAARVRASRGARGWTLDDLAARSRVSRRHIVQIEQGEANPSIGTLLKLAGALGVALTELLEEPSEAPPVAVVPADEAVTLWSTEAGGAARLLVHRDALELWRWELQPGDRRSSRPHRPGSLELLTVEEGTLHLHVGDHQVEVEAGESAWFDATLPHTYDNPGSTAVSFTLVVLDPA